MAGRIWIGPYKPLGVSSQPLPGGGYLSIDARAGQFEPSPLLQLGLQAAEGAAGLASTISEHRANDNEAVVKAADARLGETEQALFFDPRNGFLNLQGQAALTKAPAVLDALREAQDRELAETADDDQRQMLQRLNERRLATFTTQVERHAATERQRWYDEAGERRIAQMQADARLHWSDDALLRRALGTTRFEVREKATRKGWDAALTEATLRQHTSRALAAAIEAAVERDPDRAQALRTHYDRHIEGADQAALDALLTEAQTRRRAEAASTEILNAAPPDGEPATPQWRLRQAEAIAEPAVRAATIRRVLSAAAEAEARARALAEQVLTRVLKDGLTDPSQIPVREWVSLDAEHRQAIETRLDHNTAGTEPAKNPDLVDELATQMTQAPQAFAQRDLVPAVAHLPLQQWQRFHDWQSGLRRNDPATEDQIYAIKRGLQLATKMLPPDMPDGEATNVRAGLIDDINIQRRITGKSPDDADIAGMLARYLPPEADKVQTLEWDPRDRPELVPMRFPFPYPDQDDQRGILRVQGTNNPEEEREKEERDRRFWDAVAEILAILIQSSMAPPRQTPGPQPPSGPSPRPLPREIPFPPVPSRQSKRPSSPAEKAPPAPPAGTAPPSAPAANSQATRAQATHFPPGTVAGQVIGGVPAGSAGRSTPPRWHNAPPGRLGPPGTQRHHEIPQENWRPDRLDPWKFSPQAQEYFDSKIVRVMKGDHKFDADHREYNRRVSDAIQKHLDGPPPIDPSKMRTIDAKKLYEAAVINNPEVQYFRKRMLESNQEFQTRYPMWEEGR